MKPFSSFVVPAARGTASWVISLAAFAAGHASSIALSIQEFGTGSHYADLILQADAFGSDPLYYRYYFSGASIDGYALVTATDDAFANVSFGLTNFGDEESPNWFLTSVTYNSTTLTNTGAPTFSPYWVQWVSGGSAGFPTGQPVAAGSWDYGSGMSDPYRTMTSGSADAYYFSDGSAPPSTLPQPAPEPSTWLLLGLGVVFLGTRRKRHAMA